MSEENSVENQETFAEMLAREEMASPALKPGQKVEGRIIAITGDSVFVNVGLKEDGVMDFKEILDSEGKPTVGPDDKIEAWVVGLSSQGIRLSRSMAGSGIEALEEARDAALPVEGRVKGQCKGGYTVETLGKTAFCPGSQMEMPPSGKPEDVVGRQMLFLITRIENRGRNIVVSRRALLERERQENLEKLLESLKVGDTVEGRVSRMAPFGAFVELAPAVEGLVHLSELSWSRVGAPDEAVSLDDNVRVKVIAIGKDEKGNTRISLSRKQAEGDPWASVDEKFKTGDIVEGKIARLAPFGAFVELAPGIEGLAHVSEMAWGKRVNKPEEVVELGELVRVKIRDMDKENRRISLSLRDALGDPWADAADRFTVGQKVAGTVESKSPYGLFVALAPGITGLLPASVIKNAKNSAVLSKLDKGAPVELVIKNIDLQAKKISLAPESGEEEVEERDKSWKEHAKLEAPKSGSDLGIMAQALQKAMQKK